MLTTVEELLTNNSKIQLQYQCNTEEAAISPDGDGKAVCAQTRVVAQIRNGKSSCTGM